MKNKYCFKERKTITLNFDDTSHINQPVHKRAVLEEKLAFLKKDRKNVSGGENQFHNHINNNNDDLFSFEKKSSCLPKIDNSRVKLFSNKKKCKRFFKTLKKIYCFNKNLYTMKVILVSSEEIKPKTS